LSVYLLVSGPTVVSGQDQPKARAVWEYKVLNGIEISEYGGAKLPQEGLNNLGKEGWELVTITPAIPHPGSVAQSEKDSKDMNKRGAGPTVLTLAMPPFYYLKRAK